MIQHPHRLVAAALALGVVLPACAADDRITGETASSNVDVASDATLSTAPLDFGASIAPVPINVVGSETASGSELGASTDGGIVAMPDIETVFEFADDLVLPTANTGYLYRSNQPVDQAALQAVADAFGIDPGAVINWDERAEQLNASDTTTPDQALPELSLGYSASDSYQTWSFTDAKELQDLSVCEPGQPVNPGTNDPSVSVEPTDQGDALSATNPDATVPPTTVPPTTANPFVDENCVSADTPPEGVPTEQEARQLGTDLLTKLGIDVSHLDIEVFADAYSASMAAAEQSGDGIPTGRSWTINFGAAAAVSFAQGPLAKPQPVGEYPLVDLALAKERLQNTRSNMIPVDGSSFDRTPESLPANGSTGGPSSGSVPSAERIVKIVGVQPDAVFLWDNEDNTWAVPAYRFVDTDGNPWIVPAIPDDLMPAAEIPDDIPPPDVSEIPPASSMPEGIAPGPTTEPGTGASIDVSSLESLVGTATVVEFEAAAQEIGAEVRVVKIGDEELLVTADFSDSRVNIAVDGSSPDDVGQAIVTEIVSVG